MKKLDVLILFLLLFTSCRKDINDNSFLLNFSLNNAFILNNYDTILIPNGYYSDTCEYEKFNPSSNIFLNDGTIGDTLQSSCGNWTYLDNPNSSVEIWFPNLQIKNGTYNYNKNNSVNDFSISVKSNIIFDSIGIDRFNIISSFDTLAISDQGNSHYNFLYKVEMAVLKVENFNSQNSSIKYYLELKNGNIIKGSYVGNLKKFSYRYIEGDCD